MTGEKRLLLNLAGTVRLLDVAPGGRALLALSSVWHGFSGLAPGEARERDLSLFDVVVAKDLSADGRTVLFDEQGSSSPGVYVRGTDGSPAVRLGDGVARALSPDGKWALTFDLSTNTHVLLSTGPGSPRPLPKVSLENAAFLGWFPDGRRLLVSGQEPGRLPRLYEQDLAGGKTRPLTPYGVVLPPYSYASPISPDGHQVVGWDLERRPWIYPVEGGAPRPLPGFSPGDGLVRWSADGRAVFLWRRFDTPIRVFRLDLATGERRLLREISFADPVGVYATISLLLTPDGRSYVYNYGRMLSTLYLVEGLK